ncbi:unnamed protein product, partial [Hymenolepis diminuta]
MIRPKNKDFSGTLVVIGEEVFKSQKLDGDAILILFVGKSKGRLVTNSGSVTICKFF